MSFNTEKENSPISINQALQKIHALEQQAQVMGANDYEPEAFATIRRQVEERLITPEEGIQQALKVVEGKQDYH